MFFFNISEIKILTLIFSWNVTDYQAITSCNSIQFPRFQKIKKEPNLYKADEQ